MPLINTTIPNLIGGISQQPDRLKFPGQCNDSLNCYGTVKDGLKKRPYARYVANLGSEDYGEHAFTFFINRTPTERYVALYDNVNGFNVYNLLTGVKSVISGSAAYLDTGSLDEDTTLKALTVADYTFITNRSTTVNLGSTTSSLLPNEAVVFVKQGDFGKAYTVTLDGISFTHTTGGNTVASNADTSLIASAISSLIAANPAYNSGVDGNIIKIVRVDSNDFTISTKDGLGGRGIQAVYKSIDDITDLPTRCYNSFKVAVTGDSSTGDDDYWVEFQANDTGILYGVFAEGSWVESVAPSLVVDYNDNTMPITLVNTGVDAFTLDTFNWVDRGAGDNLTNPPPSFIGKQINDVFFFKNRLGFISDENVIFSESGNFGNFWRNTVQQLLDSTPIDVAVSHTSVAILRHAVVTKSRLILFSDRTQFSLKGDDLLTNATVSITPVTSFDNDLNVEPQTVGSYTYFGFQRGQYTGVREYYLDNLVNDFDQNEITSHVTNLIPQDVKTITGTTSEDQIAFFNRGKSEFFLYSFYWSAKEKAMSSWSRHEVKGDMIVSAEFIDSNLYMIVKEEGYLNLMYMPFEQGLSDGVIFESGTEAGGVSISISGLTQVTYNGIYSDQGDEYNGSAQYNGTNAVIRRSSASSLYWQIYDEDNTTVIASSINEASNPWEITYWMEQ